MTALRRFHAPDARESGQEILLSPDESLHLRRVLRLEAGDAISLFDGRGRGFSGTVVGWGGNQARVRVGEAEPESRESGLPLALAPSIAKGDKMDLVIQKCTELGVTSIQPLHTRFAEVRLDSERGEKRIERWRRVALEACKQSGRSRIPEIHPVRDLESFLKDDTPGARLVLDPAGESSRDRLRAKLEEAPRVILAVGPEGGWSAKEKESFLASAYFPFRLGPRILRSETAAIVSVALIQFLAGDLSAGGVLRPDG